MWTGCQNFLKVIFHQYEYLFLHTSKDDCIAKLVNQGFYDIGTLNNTFQYPITGSESLVPGSFYVWQIKRSYETTYGSHDELSDIFIFKMKDFENQVTLSPMLNQDKLNFIISIIGESKFNELFVDQDAPFYNYNEPDSNIKLNGEQKTFEYLQ